MLLLMGDVLKLIWWAVIGLFRSRALLEAEILALRQQLNVLRRKSPKRLVFFRWALSDCAACAGCIDDRGAGDCYSLASRRFSLVLAADFITNTSGFSFRHTQVNGPA